MAFTHLPFETDNYHMWPKSPSRFLSTGLVGDPPWQSKSPERLIGGILVLRWESKADGLWEKGGWWGRQWGVMELAFWGGQDVRGLSQLDFFSLQSLDSSRRGDKSVCGSPLFCGKNDPMLWRWSLSTSHSQIQIHAHAAHQFACQASKMGLLLLKAAGCREVSCFASEQVGVSVS